MDKEVKDLYTYILKLQYFPSYVIKRGEIYYIGIETPDVPFVILRPR